MYLCYKTPAAQNFDGWQHRAIPLGNGTIGAKVFGGVQREMIQFNEKTLFSGDSTRKGSFQNFGELFLTFNEPVPCSENTYLRDLDFETGSAMVACQKGLDGHTRHYFISAKDNVLAGKIESTGDTLLNFTLSLQSEQNGEVTYDGAYAVMKGTVNANNGAGNENGEDKNSLEYICVVKVIPDDGEMTASEEGITVKETFGARFIMSCCTSLSGENAVEKCRENVDRAADMTFPQLFRRHLDGYKSEMGAAVLNICQSDENLTTDSQLKIYRKGRGRQDIEALLFEMGKYIIYTSVGTLPMTECGLWNSRNIQTDGEILFGSDKIKTAGQTAKKLSLKRQAEACEAFAAAHENEKRYNIFGYEEAAPVVEKKKPSAFSKLFAKNTGEEDVAYILERIGELSLKGGKENEIAKLISQAASAVNDTLFMNDIADNIAFTDTVISLLIREEADKTIKLLPSLPPHWDIGSLRSVRIADAEIGFEWGSGKFRKGTLKALEDGEIRLYAHGKFVGVSDEDGNDVEEKFENGTVIFSAVKGKTYNLY